MFTFRDIDANSQSGRECARLIQKYSWGEDYPVNAWDEFKQSEYVIGCFDGDSLVGFANITRVASPDKVDNGLPWLADAVVLPEYRKRGIYAELYKRTMEYLKERAEPLVLACTDNPVIERFFAKHGWQLRRITHDEAGGVCRVFEKDQLLVENNRNQR